MTTKIDQKRPLGAIPAGFEPKKETGKAKVRSFKETLEERQGNEQNSGSLPTFPQHRAKAQAITATQAKRLAQYAPIIQHCARKYNLPVELICGVMLQESGGNPRAHSPAGARGLMQLMPATARRFGVHNIHDPVQNIEGGSKYLRWLLDHFRGNVELALAGYNAGEKNVEKYGWRIPPFRETQNYVPNVLGYCLAMIQVLSGQPAQPVVAKK